MTPKMVTKMKIIKQIIMVTKTENILTHFLTIYANKSVIKKIQN